MASSYSGRKKVSCILLRKERRTGEGLPQDPSVDTGPLETYKHLIFMYSSRSDLVNGTAFLYYVPSNLSYNMLDSVHGAKRTEL
jgi:hypothetical protein